MATKTSAPPKTVKPRRKKAEAAPVMHLEMATQLDLFLGDLTAPASKDDRATMEHPFFSIQKGGDKKIRIYEDPRSGARIEIHPSTQGSATIWDKDILIYLSTVLRKAMDANLQVSQTFTFTGQDLLKSIGRDGGGKDYKELEKALDRLVGTRVKTNIATDEQVEKENFSLLASYKLLENKHGRMERVRVTVSEWFFRAITNQEVLSIPVEYFSITSGLERRLYELVRKHCGQQPSFTIGLDRLYLKSGSTSPERRFRFELRKLLGPPPSRLLDYWVTVEGNKLHAYPDTDEGRKAYGRQVTKSLAAKRS